MVTMQGRVYGGWSMDQFSDAAAIDELLAEHPHESYSLEYKGNGWGKNGNWKQELCQQVTALANSVGGIIVWGVDENETQPARLDPLAEPVTNLRLTHILSPGVSPELDYPHLIVKTVEVAGGYVSVIFVPESHRPPHMVTMRGAGGHEGRYYKRGLEGTVIMLDSDVRDAMGKRQRPELELVVASLFHQPHSQRLNVAPKFLLCNRGKAIAQHVAVTAQAEKQPWVQPPTHTDLVGNGWSNVTTENGTQFQVMRLTMPIFPRLSEPLRHWGRSIVHGNMPQGLQETIEFRLETTIYSEATEPRLQRFVCRLPRSIGNWEDGSMNNIRELHGAEFEAAESAFDADKTTTSR